MVLVENRGATDPYINLALEEYMVRHADCSKGDFVILYINEPSIVLGKNQSLYKEVNFSYLRPETLKLARRITGGGTVYHDPGNLSFSFISKFSDSKVNNYRFFNQPVVDALLKAGVMAEMDARNNILCNGKKISGSAQFTDRKNIISHGTLLFNADLAILRACLKENDFRIETRAVGSVRSSVMNISEATDQFGSIDELRSYLIEELSISDILKLNDSEWNAVMQIAKEKMETFEWIYGRSPLTTIHHGDNIIEVENAIIRSINSDINLVGEKFQYSERTKAVFPG